MTTTTTSHVGSSSSSASICPHDNPTTHPLACNCETGWVFFILFFKATNNDDEPCRLVVIICLCLHPRQRQQPTPSLAIARQGGFLSSFFSSQQMPTTTTSHVGSSLSSASICTHDNPTTHPLACNCETGWVFYHPFF